MKSAVKIYRARISAVSSLHFVARVQAPTITSLWFHISSDITMNAEGMHKQKYKLSPYKSSMD